MSLAQARLLIGIQRWSEARAELTRVLADPDAGADPWFLLAQTHLGLAEPVAARAAAERGIALAADSEWGYRLLSLAQLRCGQARAAQRSAELALGLRPGKPETMYALTSILLRRGRRRQAEQVAVGNVAANPLSALAQQAAASVALSRRRWADAERHARAGLRIDPQSADLMIQLGAAQQAQGRPSEAAESYAAASRANPADQRGRRALGRIGMTMAGGGLLGFKLLIVLALVLDDGWWLAGQGSRQALKLALLIGVSLSIGYGYQEFRQRRAVARIRPQLRAVAWREHRSTIRPWLRVAAVAALLLTGFAVVEHDVVTAVGLLAVTTTALYLRHRWGSARTGGGWNRWRAQSIRWRLR